MSPTRVPPLPIVTDLTRSPRRHRAALALPAEVLAGPLSPLGDPAVTRRLDRGRLSLTDVAAALGWTPGTALVAELAEGRRILLRTPGGAEAGHVLVDQRHRVVLDRHLRAWMELPARGVVLIQTCRRPDGGALLIAPCPDLAITHRPACTERPTT